MRSQKMYHQKKKTPGHGVPGWLMASCLATFLLLGLLPLMARADSTVKALEPESATLILQQRTGGTVVVAPDRRVFPIGTPVTLTARADPGWVFTRWSGTVDSSQITRNPLVLSMNRDRLISANFLTTTYSVVTALSGSGSGSISLVPDESSYAYGTVVTAIASPDPSSTFSGWQGDLNGVSAVEQLTVTQDSMVTATFSLAELKLELFTDGDGGGTVSSAPPGPVHLYGQAITITATPDWLSSFVGWHGKIGSDQAVESFAISQSGAVTATFTRQRYVLDVNSDVGGRVERAPDQAAYQFDQPVTVTASADPGWVFHAWDGDLASRPASTGVTMTTDIRATAHFTQVQYDLSTDVVGMGSIARTPDQTSYTYGDEVVVEAVADPGWRFKRWHGDLNGEEVQQTLTMTNSRRITAEFIRVYRLNIWQTGEGETSVTPEHVDYLPGTVVSVRAEAAPGWQFTGWRGDIVDSSCCLTVIMNRDLSLRAIFKQFHTLSILKEGQGSVVISPEQPLYLSGETVRLRAFPDPGWSFAGWRGDLVDGEAVVDFPVAENAEVVARFAQEIYSFDLLSIGRGSVATDPPGPFIYDEVVALIAVPAWEWTFLGWSQETTYDPAAIISTDRVFITRVSANETYIAHFGEREAWSNYLPLIER